MGQAGGRRATLLSEYMPHATGERLVCCGYLVAVESPGAELHVAALLVERKVLDVDSARTLVDRIITVVITSSSSSSIAIVLVA